MRDLVEKVATAIQEHFSSADKAYGEHRVCARDAIKAVAEWLDEQHQIDRDGSVNCALSKQLKEGSE